MHAPILIHNHYILPVNFFCFPQAVCRHKNTLETDSTHCGNVNYIWQVIQLTSNAAGCLAQMCFQFISGNLSRAWTHLSEGSVRFLSDIAKIVLATCESLGA